MIHFMLLISRQGKVRLTKWYSSYSQKERSKVIRELSGVILTRGPKLCNFVEWRGYKVVYKRYASLYFCMCIDQEDNELEVCELDLIFNFHKAYYILDELLIAGELQESSKKTVARLISAQIHWLRRDDVIAQAIRWVQDVLWPDGTFFLRVGSAQSNSDDNEPSQKPFQTSSQFGGTKFSALVSFEEQLEASRRARDVKKMLFDGAPAALVSLIGHKQYKHCARDIYYFTQCSICVKQLAYGILELLLISVFPELWNLVLEVHEKMSPPDSV